MAETIKRLKEIKIKNPELWKFIVNISERINEVNRSAGLPEQSLEQLTNFEIVVTDETTPEEERMQYVEYFLKRGYSLEEAEKEADRLKRLIDAL